MLILKQWLKDSGKTQIWLATQLDVSQPTISDWIKGNTSPTTDKLRRLASVTGLTIDTLLDDEMEETREVITREPPRSKAG